MARINLLPWRAERQKERKKQFILMLVMSAVAGLAAWFLVNTYYSMQISGQEARNAYLDQEIVAVKAKITVDQLAQAFTVYPSLSGSVAEASRRLHGSAGDEQLIY